MLGVLEGALISNEFGGDLGAQVVVLVREQILEAQVGELGLVLPHAQPMRERREDLERLARDRGALVHRHVLERAHVVQTIGELHHDHAPVIGHGDEHAPHILHLLLRLGRGLERIDLAADHLWQLRNLGLAFDDLAHRRAEKPLELVEREARVLYRVVKQPGNNR